MKSVFWKMFLSYIFVLILPLLIMGMVCYWWVSDIVAGQVRQSYSTIMSEVKTSVDNRFKELNSFTIQLSQTPWVKKIMYMHGASIDNDRMDVIELTDHVGELQGYDAINNFINTIILAFPEKNYVVSSMGTSAMDVFFDETCRLDRINYNQFKTRLEKYNLIPEILPPNTLYTYNTPQKVVTYIQSVPSLDQKSRAVFITYLKDDVFEGVLDELLLLGDISLYISDSGGNTINEVNVDPGFKEILLRDADKTSEIVYELINIEGEKYFTFHSTSDVNGWRYNVIIPYNTVMHKTSNIKILTVILALLLTAIGFAVSYRFAVRNYTPLSQLINRLNGQPVQGRIRKYNEYDYIGNAIDSLLTEDDLLRRKAEQHKTLIRNIYLLKLLDASINADDKLLELLESVNVRFRYPDFLVILFKLQEAKGMNEEIQAIITDNMDSNSFDIYFAEVDGKRKAAILCCDYHSLQKNVIIKLKTALEEELGVKSTVGAGELCHLLRDIPRSYREAQIAIDYRLIDDKIEIIYFEDVEVKDKTYYYYPIDKEGKILNGLRIGNLNATMDIVDDIINTNMQDNRLSIATAKCLFYDLMGTAYKALNELPIQHSIGIDQERVSGLETITGIRMYLEEIFKEICSLIHQKKKSHNEILKESIKLYVEENFAIQDMSLESVANTFSLSASYLSKFFKEQFGVNFLDYLQQKRVEAAKTLLNGQLTIAQIAGMVGYFNDETFRRVFKKYEGITPGEYKSIG